MSDKKRPRFKPPMARDDPRRRVARVCIRWDIAHHDPAAREREKYLRDSQERLEDIVDGTDQA